MRARWIAALACVSPGVLAAQDVSTGPRPAPAAATPVACGDRTAAFADRKTRLWVTRRGTIVEDNPLRPLSTDPVLVLEVIVGGRAATAVGPDWDSLHRAPALAALEEQNRHMIAWASDGGLPNAFRIVSEDGALASAFTFTECGDAPKIAAAPVAAARRPGRRPAGTREGAAAEPAAPRGFALPQGAVPESALPKGAIR